MEIALIILGSCILLFICNWIYYAIAIIRSRKKIRNLREEFNGYLSGDMDANVHKYVKRFPESELAKLMRKN